jgi:transposase
LAVSQEDEQELQKWLRSGTTRRSLAERARIILLSAEGLSADRIADKLGIVRHTVFKWRRRYREAGVSGLNDRQRPGRPRKLSSEKSMEIVKLTTDRIPRDAKQWSVRLMARHAEVTTWQVRQVWGGANLQPHRAAEAIPTADPDLVDRLVDIVGFAMAPPHNACVFAARPAGPRGPMDGISLMPVGKISHDPRVHLEDERHGPVSVYSAFDVATAGNDGQLAPSHSVEAVAQMLRRVDREAPGDVVLHVIADKKLTVEQPDVAAFLSMHPRFTVHVVGSTTAWLAAVEAGLGRLRQRRDAQGVDLLRQEVRGFIERREITRGQELLWATSTSPTLHLVDHVT